MWRSIGLGLALLTHAVPVVAEGMPDRVHVALPECTPEPFSYDELEAGLRLELGHAGVREVVRGAAPNIVPGEALLVLLVPCPPDAPAATLVVRSSGGELTRSLDLSDLDPPLRPRGIALQIADLLPVAWPELIAAAPSETPEEDLAETSDSPSQPTAAFAVEAPSPDAAPEESQEPAEPPTDTTSGGELAPPPPAPTPPTRGQRTVGPWAAGGALQTRTFLPRGTTLFGARPTISWRRFDAAFDVLLGRHSNRVGTLDSRLLAGALAWRVLQPEWGGGAWRGTVAPRAALGTVFARAKSTAAGVATSQVREIYADVALATGVDYVGRRCLAGPKLELGYARGFIARHDQQRIADFGGPQVSTLFALSCGGR